MPFFISEYGNKHSSLGKGKEDGERENALSSFLLLRSTLNNKVFEKRKQEKAFDMRERDYAI